MATPEVAHEDRRHRPHRFLSLVVRVGRPRSRGARPRAARRPRRPAGAGETLIDQQTVTCWYGAHLEVRVVDAYTAKTVQGKDARGSGLWLVAIVDATNLDQERGEGVFALKLQDDRGRAFGWTSVGTVAALALANELGVE